MEKDKYTVLTFLFCVSIVLSGCELETNTLTWHSADDYSWAEVNPGYFGDAGFKRVSPSKTNINFSSYVSPEEINQNQILLNGTGVATADIDNDGLVDIYFAQLSGPNKLYRNVGNFKFEDITEQAGVAHTGNYSRGVMFADVDGDSDQDLLITTVSGENALYINDGTGKFTLKEDSGLQRGQGSTTMTMADIDSDGDLDLFVANNKEKPVYDIFSEQELESRNLVKRPEGKQIPGKTRYEFKEPFGEYYRFVYRKNLRAIMKEVGEYNRLYLNDGKGNFTDVTNDSARFLNQKGEPANLKREWSLTARFQDINGDQLPDLYICNDYFTPDRVWLNQGNGQFKEMSHESIRNFSYSSMGIASSDINRDGYTDLFVTEMLSPLYERRARQFHSKDLRPAMAKEAGYQPQYMKNSLYLNRGDHSFAEIAYYSGVEASEWSWATRFLDIDLDGYDDLIINTGYPYDAIDRDYSYNSSRYKDSIDLNASPPLNLKNKIFRNNGDLTFSDMSEQWGINETDVSYGMATADFDNDGDLDIVTTKFNSTASILENSSTAPRVAVQLQGQDSNNDGVGAKVTLEGGPVIQTKEVVSGGEYLSSSAPQLVFAASSENENHTLTVEWPSGRESIIDSVAPNRIYRISEPKTDGNPKNEIQQSSDLNNESVFQDISDSLNHSHTDETFDDWKLQPLLPLKLSQGGPGILWMDYDQDGNEDLFVTGGSGGKLSIFNNTEEDNFSKTDFISEDQLSGISQTSIVGWKENNITRIVVGISNYEEQNVPIPSALVYSITKDGQVERSELPSSESTTGPIAAADYDSDGDMELFIGGRAIPKKYPENATSRLFDNKNGKLVVDEENKSLLQDVGLVTGAVFSDIDQDGDQDLLLSREWDSILILENSEGIFTDASQKYGIEKYKGWWNSISTGDFNNDGRPDILATNMGLNSAYQIKEGHPLKLFYNDFSMNGSVDIIDADYSTSLESYVPRDKLFEHQPFRSLIMSKLSSFEEYANSPLDELINIPLQQISQKEINTLQHVVLLNEGDHFDMRSLPVESQFSIAFDARVSDYNSDGNEDIFMTQNFFEVSNGVSRMDNGRGLWLKGNGDGEFRTVSGNESGIKIYGQQRGASLSDFNKDGKIDLVVSQNDSTTKLYTNQFKKRGIRIQLIGQDDNIQAFGSSLRVVYEDESKGARREIQAGSGYWSQNSSTQILGINPIKEVSGIEISWYNGKREYKEFEHGKMNYRFRFKD